MRQVKVQILPAQLTESECWECKNTAIRADSGFCIAFAVSNFSTNAIVNHQQQSGYCVLVYMARFESNKIVTKCDRRIAVLVN